MQTQEIHTDKLKELSQEAPKNKLRNNWLKTFFNASTRSLTEPSEPKLFTTQDRKVRKKNNKAARASRRTNRIRRG